MTDNSVLYISSDYPPDSSPGATRSVELVGRLPEFGYDPVVLAERHAQYPNIPSWYLPDRETTIDDASNERRHIDGAHGNSHVKFHWLKQKLKALVPMDGSWTGTKDLVTKATELHRKTKFDLIFVTCNPLSPALAAVTLKKRLGIPLVVEFRDPWTLHPYRKWATRTHYIYERGCERRVLSAADAVVLNTSLARQDLIQKRNYPDERSHCIPHGFEPARYSAGAASRTAKMTIGFCGSFYFQANLQPWGGKPAHNPLSYSPTRNIQVAAAECSPRPLFDALASIKKQYPTVAARLKLKFTGTLRESDVAYVDDNNLRDHVSDVGRISPAEIPGFLLQCDLLYLTNLYFVDRPSPFVSTKTIEYLAARKPILATLPDGDNRTIVERSGLGFCFHQGSGQSLRDLLLEFSRQHANGGIRSEPNDAFIAQFERRHHAKCLARIFDQALGRSSPSPVFAVEF